METHVYANTPFQNTRPCTAKICTVMELSDSSCENSIILYRLVIPEYGQHRHGDEMVEGREVDEPIRFKSWLASSLHRHSRACHMAVQLHRTPPTFPYTKTISTSPSIHQQWPASPLQPFHLHLESPKAEKPNGTNSSRMVPNPPLSPLLSF